MGNGDRQACSFFSTECLDGVVSVVLRIHDHVAIAKGVTAMVQTTIRHETTEPKGVNNCVRSSAVVESERPSTISEIAVEVVLLMRSYCSHITYVCIPSKGLKYSIQLR